MLYNLLILLCYIAPSFSKVRYQDGSLSWNQTYRVFWSEDISIPKNEVCEAVVILGVGTSMRISNYNALASNIVEDSQVIVVIADHNSGFMMKLFALTFRKFYNRFMNNLNEHIPSCTGKEPFIFIGGHSASGQAVINAIPQLHRKADGFIGLDPYKITLDMSLNDHNYSLPTLIWGFEKTTCSVNVDWAGKIAYEISSHQRRIFYRIKNDHFDISHCIFTDNGCGYACGEQKGGEWVKHAVAISLQRFIETIKRGYSFSKSEFRINQFDSEYDLFVNHDDPDVHDAFEMESNLMTNQ